MQQLLLKLPASNHTSINVNKNHLHTCPYSVQLTPLTKSSLLHRQLQTVVSRARARAPMSHGERSASEWALAAVSSSYLGVRVAAAREWRLPVRQVETRAANGARAGVESPRHEHIRPRAWRLPWPRLHILRFDTCARARAAAAAEVA